MYRQLSVSIFHGYTSSRTHFCADEYSNTLSPHFSKIALFGPKVMMVVWMKCLMVALEKENCL